MYWLSQDKWLLISESHDDLNWCTSCRRNLMRMTRTLSYATWTLPSCNPRMWQSFTLIQNSWTDTLLSLEKVLSTLPHIPVEWPAGPAPFYLPITTIKVVRLSQASIEEHDILVYWVSYIQHVISTFNTFSRGSIYLSLSDIDEGYNLGSLGFPHHSLHPS
jgi:hypothetical protein